MNIQRFQRLVLWTVRQQADSHHKENRPLQRTGQNA